MASSPLVHDPGARSLRWGVFLVAAAAFTLGIMAVRRAPPSDEPAELPTIIVHPPDRASRASRSTAWRPLLTGWLATGAAGPACAHPGYPAGHQRVHRAHLAFDGAGIHFQGVLLVKHGAADRHSRAALRGDLDARLHPRRARLADPHHGFRPRDVKVRLAGEAVPCSRVEMTRVHGRPTLVIALGGDRSCAPPAPEESGAMRYALRSRWHPEAGFPVAGFAFTALPGTREVAPALLSSWSSDDTADPARRRRGHAQRPTRAGT